MGNIQQTTEVRETCREWSGEMSDRCNQLAEVILWGKLFPKDALGPRCRYHAESHLQGRSLPDVLREGWAVFDLHNLRRSR